VEPSWSRFCPQTSTKRTISPGAISIPLRQVNRESAKQLDPSRDVIVYCWDMA